MSLSVPVFACECKEPQVYRLKFSGGSDGDYIIEYCQRCYDNDDKQFLMSEDRISGGEE